MPSDRVRLIRAAAAANPGMGNAELGALLGLDRRRVFEALQVLVCACGREMTNGARRCRECTFEERHREHERLLARIERMWKAGATQTDIRHELGWGARSVPPQLQELRRRGRIGYRHARQGRELLEVRDSLIAGMRADGWLNKEIAHALGMTEGGVINAVRRLDLPRRHVV